MPYISPHRRDELDFYPNPETVGELNFVITSMVLKFLGANPHYEDYNGVIGVLECAKLELARRSLSNYENHKIKINGDLNYPDTINVHKELD